MDSGETKKATSETEKMFQIFLDFMTRITEFEALVDVGNKLLHGFQQGLVFLRKPPVNKTSKLIERVIEANSTKRLLSYVEAGCVNTHDRIQNMNKSKDVVNKLECLVNDASAVLKTCTENLPSLHDDDDSHLSDVVEAFEKEILSSSDLQTPEITDYAAIMAVIYSMVKQDYLMQEKIGVSLNLKSSYEELGSYCLMWSLRPYINDEVIHQAWKLIP